MKHTKRISALLLSILMLCATFMLCACQTQGGEDNSNEATYRVTVVDGVGTPYSEKVVVKFMQNGAQVGMGAVNANGVVEKTLPKGDYTIEVDSTAGKKCYFDAAAAKLSADKTEVTVTMAYEADEQTTTLYANSLATGENVAYEALSLNLGSVYVTLETDDRNYFLFVPTVAGEYEISVTADNATLGYYGAPHFVQPNNVGTVENGVLKLSVYADMISSGATGTSVFVIGVDAKDGVSDIILNVARVGEPAWTITSEPWMHYNPKHEITDFSLPAGTKLTAFDVTASTDTYKLVLNEQDHCYHLGSANGPMVYVQLEKAVYGISLMTMVGEIVYDQDGVLMQTGTTAFRYMYDNGPDDFFKEDYTDAMRQYVTARDKATGVYPLNEDLYYILPMGIESNGWCRENTINYVFGGVENVNSEISWMFLLCHGEGDISADVPDSDPDVDPDSKPDTKPDNGSTPTGPVEDNKDAPIVIGSTLNFDAEVKANHIVYFDLMRINETTLTIKSKDAYVIYNGKKYEAKNGVVTVPNLYSQYTNIPVSIQIGNKGTQDATFAVSLTYPEGHKENPIKLSAGSLSTKQKSGDSDGVYYTFTAVSAGTLTITVESTTKGTYAGISIMQVKDGIPVVTVLPEGSNTVTLELAAGETVEVNICAVGDVLGTYPMSTIKSTVTFG